MIFEAPIEKRLIRLLASEKQLLSESRKLEPLVSVIIPTFNRAALLMEALCSVLKQTYRPIEVLIVDDGSTDETSHLIKAMIQECSSDGNLSIRYSSQQNSGPSNARNAGLRQSKGDFIQFLDSDDLLHPRKLELQVEAMKQHPQCGYVFSNLQHFNEAPLWMGGPFPSAELVRGEQFHYSHRLLTMVGLYRRQICFAIGGWDAGMKIGEDLEFHHRVLLQTPTLAYVAAELSACREHKGPRLTNLLLEDGALRIIQTCEDLRARAFVSGVPPAKAVEALAVLYCRGILEALMRGDRTSALAGLKACRMMPLSEGRLRRLNLLVCLSYCPAVVARIAFALLKASRRSPTN